MTIKLLALFSFGVLMTACNISATSLDAFQRKERICRDFANPGEKGWCFPKLKMISKNYGEMSGKIYWVRKEITEKHLCGKSSGDPHAIFSNVLTPSCWTNDGARQVQYRGEYRIILVAKKMDNFSVLGVGDNNLAKWQQEQLEEYAIDDGSVYFRGVKIDIASPRDFSVAFPFGDEDRWKIFSVSKSGGRYFMRGNLVEGVQLEEFQQFDPVQCPQHGLPCTSEKDSEFSLKYGHFALGWVGDDVVLLRKDGVNLYKGMMSTDTFMFSSINKVYLFSRGKFYELRSDKEGSFSAVSGKSIFVDMDFEYFRDNSY